MDEPFAFRFDAVAMELEDADGPPPEWNGPPEPTAARRGGILVCLKLGDGLR